MLAFVMQDIKPVKFRIRNYKSIIDSGDCLFHERITILAGKNESGKSSVLEALEDFNEDKKIRSGAKRTNTKESYESKIAVAFHLSANYFANLIANFEYLNSSSKKADIDACKKAGIDVTLTKWGANGNYELDDDFLSKLGIEDTYSSDYQQVNDLLDEVKDVDFSANQKDDDIDMVIPSSYESFEDLLEKLEKLSESINRDDSNSADENTSDTENKESADHDLNLLIANKNKDVFNTMFGEISKIVENYLLVESIRLGIINRLVGSDLPRFILFSSFSDKFPNSISIAKLDDDKWALDLQEMSVFDISLIKSKDKQKRQMHEDEINSDFEGKFKKHWTQDDIKLKVRLREKEIQFWIDEKGIPYEPKQRSTGQQWYLSFFIKIVAKIEEKNCVILIDEPGLYLHPKAQKDLLQVLKEYSSDYPIVFSTHSSYLIEANSLDSIRLVEKDSENGSRIFNKLHDCPNADKETLTPILRAIGLEIGDSITDVGQNSVVVEGITDVYYLQAFRKLYPDANNIKEVKFINGGGASNMWQVGAILQGWGADVMYLFDNDQGGRTGRKMLERQHVPNERIEYISGEKNTSIENLFSKGDFNKHVLEGKEYDKNKKVLMANNFLQKVNGEKVSKLDSRSEKNIRQLLEKFKFGNE